MAGPHPHCEERVNRAGEFAKMNSRFAREKFEVMSVVHHQRGTRYRTGFQAHLFPTMMNVSLGGRPSFTPFPTRIRPISLIASGRVAFYFLRGKTTLDHSPWIASTSKSRTLENSPSETPSLKKTMRSGRQLFALLNLLNAS